MCLTGEPSQYQRLQAEEAKAKPTLLLELEDAIHQSLAGRWAARHINIDRDNSIAATGDGVAVMIVSTTVGTATHADDPSRLGHLIVNLSQGWSHLVGQGSGDNHDIGLARRSSENDSQSILIVTRGGQVHHLDGTARQSKSQRPQRALSGPVGNLIKSCQGVLHGTLLGLLTREGNFAAKTTCDR